jgi:hypothetical protein
MKTFAVTITTQEGAKHQYTAISSHSFDVWDAAITTFGLCKVKVTLQ